MAELDGTRPRLATISAALLGIVLGCVVTLAAQQLLQGQRTTTSNIAVAPVLGELNQALDNGVRDRSAADTLPRSENEGSRSVLAGSAEPSPVVKPDDDGGPAVEAQTIDKDDPNRFVHAAVERLRDGRTNMAARQLLQALIVRKYNHEGNYIDITDIQMANITELVGPRKDEPHFVHYWRGTNRIYIVGEDFPEYGELERLRRSQAKGGYYVTAGKLPDAYIEELIAKAEGILATLGDR